MPTRLTHHPPHFSPKLREERLDLANLGPFLALSTDRPQNLPKCPRTHFAIGPQNRGAGLESSKGPSPKTLLGLSGSRLLSEQKHSSKFPTLRLQLPSSIASSRTAGQKNNQGLLSFFFFSRCGVDAEGFPRENRRGWECRGTHKHESKQ